MQFYLETLADPEYFAPLETWRLDAIRNPHLAAIPSGPIDCPDIPSPWHAEQRGPWTVVAPIGHQLQPQGWKAHLAPMLEDVRDVVERTARLCVRRGWAFKYLSRYEYAWALNGKYAPREASGKIVVFYPNADTDPDAFFRKLFEEFGALRGPRILGDHRLGDSIVHARYGSFVARHVPDAEGEPVLAMADATGRLIPDRRGVRPHTPEFVERPAIFDELPADRPAGSDRPIYRVRGALHMSNTGGVYRATNTETGDEVVLKEARHHTGRDAGLRPATERLRAQRDAMRRLRDIGAVPEVLDHFTQGDSDFLVYRFVEGSTLQEWSAARNPALIQPQPDRPVPWEAAQRFAAAVTRHIERLARIVADAHRAGVALVDLHPANVIVGSDGELWLIDLEAAADAEDESAVFVGAQGFCRPGVGGRAADEFGLAAVELYLYVPMLPMTSYVPGALAGLIDFAAATFQLSPQWRTDMRKRLGVTERTGTFVAAEAIRPRLERYCATLAETLSGCCDFEDRYPIPCSPTGFGEFTRFGISHGPAGVVWALSRHGAVPEPVATGYRTWLGKNLDHFGALGNGLLDGWSGNIVVSAEIGADDLAEQLLDRFLATAEITASGTNVRGGLAGQILLAVWCRNAGLTVTPEWLESAADELRRRVEAILERGEVVPTGLLNGLSGAALALIRAHEVVPRRAYLATATAALDAELTTYEPHDAAEGLLFHWDKRIRLLSYLDRGNAGLLIAAAESGGRWHPGARTVAALQRAACSRVGVQPGLYIGLTGGLAANAVLRHRTDWLDGEYLDRCNEAIAASVATFSGPGAGGFHVPGQLSARAAVDFATGAAGVLAALSFWSGRSSAWLPGICR
ncbi:hypothetical protein NDR87_10785 [Nocardia sp. CDC159]|uniref:Protein kinase domain-containing protein n=1 Tax=Nocardia pulmonis TaxID=2951408 RepID=A0A9X2E920_9NOCA|nr:MULTISPECIES: hypothetical protein [Nocardia]MCM6773956.1 hypothetical protein [Nocardia pulmonis]MCM6786843.1 hypothetical protein [Nocardia sp. CDC159]